MQQRQQQTPTEAYERALFRAREAGLEVMARGRRKADGARIFAVNSTSSPDRWRVVVVAGDHLECDCPAGKHGRMCVHRAIARAELLKEAANTRMRVEETRLAFALGVAEGMVEAAARRVDPTPVPAPVQLVERPRMLGTGRGPRPSFAPDVQGDMVLLRDNRPASQWMWK